MVITIELKAPNNNLHSDCYKRHGFCEEKEPQKTAPLIAAGEVGVML